MNIRPVSRVVTVLSVVLVLAACGRADPETLIASAKSYLAKNDPKAATIQLKNALQEVPNNAEARFLLAKSLLESADPGGAETEVRKAINLKYADDETIPLLARALLGQNEYRKVVSELADRKLTSPQARADAMTSLGLAYLGLGELKEGRAAIEAALAAKPGDSRAQVAQAQLLMAENDLPGALKVIDAALASAPDDVQALLVKADLEVAHNRRELATKALERVVELRPDSVAARWALISSLVRSGQIDVAAAQLESLKKLAPQDPRTLHAEAIVAYARGNMPAAKEAIQQVLSVAPGHLPSLLLSGLVNYQLGSYAAAEEALRAVIAKVPDAPGAMRTLTATYLRTGRAGLALEMLEPALRRSPNDPGLLRAAAEVYLASNNPAKAAELYEKAGALDKDNVAGSVRLAEVRIVAGDTARAFKDLEALAAANPSMHAADMALISAHLRRRELDQAFAAVTAFEKKQPANPMVYNLKGVVFVAKRDFKSARENFEQALKMEAGYVTAAFNLAQLDLAERNTDGARKRYEQLLVKDPKNEQTLLALAGLLANTKAPAPEIKATIERAIAANPTSVRARLAMVGFVAQQKDAKGAVTAAKEAQSAFPENPQVLEVLGAAQQAAGENNQALETLTRAAKLQPQSTMPLVRLAGAQATGKDYDSAIGSLRKALALQPDLPAAWLTLAGVYVAANRVGDGIADARKLQREYPNRAVGFALEGELLGNQKKWPEAATAFRNGLVREPIPLLSVRAYGALVAAGKQDQATVMAQRWAKEHPKDAMLRNFQGQQSLAAKDYRGAAQQFRAVLEVEPDNTAVLNNLAWALNELGDPKAIEYAERASMNAPYTPAVMDTHGWILFQHGDAKRGLDLLRKANDLAPQNPEIRLHLAKALLKSGDKAAGKSELETIAVQTRPSPARTEAQQLLKNL